MQEDIKTSPSLSGGKFDGIDVIKWRADNLLDQQLMEAFGEVVEKQGTLKVLELMQQLVKL